MSDDPDDEVLDEDDEQRVERTRNVRRGRRGRERTPQQAPQAQQDEGGEQAEQEDVAKQGKQADGDNEEDPQMEAPQAPQEEQAEGAGQAQQPAVSELEPVTQREHDTYYLDEDLRAELERVYRRMSLDMLEAADVDLDDQRIGGRNRYFRPLALLLGARQIGEMSPEELRQTLEEEELIDDLPDPDK